MEDDDNPEAGGGFDETMADTPSDDTSDGGGTPTPEGGEPAPEGGNPLDAALSAVDAAMSYGRQKHGLLNGKQESGNIEDRRGDAPGPEQMSTYGANQQAMRNPGQPMPSSARNAWSAVAGKMSGRMGFAEGGPVEDEEDQQQIESGDESGGGGQPQQPEAEAPPQKRGFREQLGDAIGMRGRGQQQRVARPGGLDTEEGPTPGQQYGPPKPKDNIIKRGAEGLGFNNPDDPSPVKRILSYLQGKDAAPAQSMQQLEQSVDPDGSMDPAQRNVLAVAAAKEQGGDEGAWAAAQHYRRKYDASRSFAQVALDKGNLPSAADAATKAYPNLLDGRPVTFQISQNGIVATLQDKEGSQLNLSLPQFKQWLSGLPGQFDHARQRGGFETLQQMAQGGQQGGGGQPQQQPQQEPDEDPDTGYPRQLEMRARQIFPMVSQGRQKAMWMAQQMGEQGKLTNRVDVANVQGANRTEAAKATGDSRVSAAAERAGGERYKADQRFEGSKLNAEARKHVADQNLQQRVVTMMRTAQDAKTRAQAAVLASKIKNVPFGTPLTPQDSAAVDALFGGADAAGPKASPDQISKWGQQPQQGQPQQQAAPAGQPQQQQPKFAPGAGWQQSPSTGMYRDPQGHIWSKDGQLVK